MTATQQRRVLILCHSPLFAASLKALLEREKGLEVLIEQASGPQEPQAMQSPRPHVLIVEDEALPQEESDCSQDYTPTVIRLSLKSNAMRVSYEGLVSSADSEDLVRAVKSSGVAPKGRRERQGARS
ncbi:MAG: hypothetical protein HW388_1741 [Dehalococcoidia bacterium]|nr:hypothetical protein [Dehalococcoidia bacterium]